MKHLAVLTGVVLIGIGLAGYFSQTSGAAAGPDAAEVQAAKKRSPTALIPAGFGAIILVLGIAAHREPWRKHALHGAAAIALLGAIAAAGRGVPSVITMISEGQPPGLATGCLCLMFLVCAAFVLLCVGSFVSARRAKTK